MDTIGKKLGLKEKMAYAVVMRQVILSGHLRERS